MNRLHSGFRLQLLKFLIYLLFPPNLKGNGLALLVTHGTLWALLPVLH